MNACQALPAVILLFATVSAPLSGVSVQAQDGSTGADTAPAEETASTNDLGEKITSAEKTQDVAPNPFVPATERQADTVANAPVPTQPTTAPQAEASDKITETQTVVPEESVMPVPAAEPEEVVMPISTPTVVSVPALEPRVYFDAPAASQSDRRISKEKVTQLRQQRALYRANQRMARMEYNLWMGHQPLRPDWNPMPMMSSRYAPPTIVVPIFVNPR